MLNFGLLSDQRGIKIRETGIRMEWIKRHLFCLLCYCTVIKHQVYSSGCPKNWRQYNGFCYLYTTYFKPHDQGQHFCENFLQGSLVDVADESENMLISNLTSSKAWLRFRRCHNQRFYWTDSSPANFTAWERGQPDNKGEDEQCVFMSRNGNWSDGICLERKAFVCQNFKINCTKIQDCYVVKTLPAKWHEARSKCQADGFRLAKISNIIENNAIKSLLKGVRQAWIGLERQNIFCFKDKISYQNWDFHEPNDRALVENCVAIGNNGKWSDEDCNSSLAVICRRDLDECIHKEASGCDENSVCSNTAGSFTCSECKNGYSRDGNSCSRKYTAAIILGTLFGVSCLIILFLCCYVLRKKKRWI
ncbi:C-type mannose receptor 2-like [Dendronephthya gigantea]|uniref:C-type mannose receptor 2-like n=1 Tax=Dendronephthya gigantea TaxID=151771 RepID=UPI00106DBADB|nr:C-type mannose receptor 2-like [Dendronephthya gigantea]